MFWQAQQGQLNHFNKIRLILNFSIKADSVHGTFLLVKWLGIRLAMQGSIPDLGTKISPAVQPPSLQATTAEACALWSKCYNEKVCGLYGILHMMQLKSQGLQLRPNIAK